MERPRSHSLDVTPPWPLRTEEYRRSVVLRRRDSSGWRRGGSGLNGVPKKSTIERHPDGHDTGR
jgi:hypothetical protein